MPTRLESSPTVHARDKSCRYRIGASRWGPGRTRTSRCPPAPGGGGGVGEESVGTRRRAEVQAVARAEGSVAQSAEHVGGARAQLQGEVEATGDGEIGPQAGPDPSHRHLLPRGDGQHHTRGDGTAVQPELHGIPVDRHHGQVRGTGEAERRADGGGLDRGRAVGIAHQAVGQPHGPGIRRPRPGHAEGGGGPSPSVLDQTQQAGLDHLAEGRPPVAQPRTGDLRRSPLPPGSGGALALLDEAHGVPGPEEGVGRSLPVEQGEGGPTQDRPPARGGLGVDRGEPAGQRHRAGGHRGPGCGTPGDRCQAGGEADQVREARGEAQEGHG